MELVEATIIIQIIKLKPKINLKVLQANRSKWAIGN
jgi:hypothetical protein